MVSDNVSQQCVKSEGKQANEANARKRVGHVRPGSFLPLAGIHGGLAPGIGARIDGGRKGISHGSSAGSTSSGECLVDDDDAGGGTVRQFGILSVEVHVGWLRGGRDGGTF